jgi:hypothetical protein
MHYVAWSAKMNTPIKTGGTLRDNLEVAATRGNMVARRMLIGPARPIALEYLWSWFMELRVGAGQGFNGIAPLTWTELDAWARLTQTRPYPHEVKALFSLDLIARNPESSEEKKTDAR